MGGTLAAWLTARNPAMAGLVAINGMFEPPAPIVPRACCGHRSTQGIDRFAGIGSDIALPGVSEGAYPATPLVAADLVDGGGRRAPRPVWAQIRCPVLILTSPQDHVVPPSSSDVLAVGGRRAPWSG